MVIEAPDLAAGGHPEVVALSEQAHRPIKQPLLQAQPPGPGRARAAAGWPGRW